MDDFGRSIWTHGRLYRTWLLRLIPVISLITSFANVSAAQQTGARDRSSGSSNTVSTTETFFLPLTPGTLSRTAPARVFQAIPVVTSYGPAGPGKIQRQFDRWELACSDGKPLARDNCEVGQTIVSEADAAQGVTVLFYFSGHGIGTAGGATRGVGPVRDAKSSILKARFIVPLGTEMPSGLALIVGVTQLTNAELRRCNQVGCSGEIVVPPEMMALLVVENSLQVTWQRSETRTVSMTLPTASFAAAIDSMAEMAGLGASWTAVQIERYKAVTPDADEGDDRPAARVSTRAQWIQVVATPARGNGLPCSVETIEFPMRALNLRQIARTSIDACGSADLVFKLTTYSGRSVASMRQTGRQLQQSVGQISRSTPTVLVRNNDVGPFRNITAN